MENRAKYTDEELMRFAILQAKHAAGDGEVPVGAVIARKGQIVSFGRNHRETKKNAILHAEIEAIDAACKQLSGWRLHECDIYVTLEPCPMCAGAIINARIKRVFFGAYDKKSGSFGSLINLTSYDYNHKPIIIGGFLKDDCAKLLSDFFNNLRKNKKLKNGKD